MVGKEISLSLPVSRRKVSSAATASISVSFPFGASRSSQARKRVSAAPSRRCASRMPEISVSFLIAFRRSTGSAPFDTTPPDFSTASASALEAVAWSSRIVRPPAAIFRSATMNWTGSSTAASLESASRTVFESLRPSMKSDGLPSRGTIAQESGSGVWETSLPRMLKVQATGGRVRQYGGVELIFLQDLADAREFCLARFAGVTQIVQGDRRERRRRPLGPDRIDRIGFGRIKLGARLLAGLLQLLDAVDRGARGVVAEGSAGFQVLREPFLRRMLDHMFDREHRGIDLRARFDGVAAVDEERRLLHEHHRDPGRAGKSGEPAEPVLAGGHVFVLVLVGAQHNEAIELALGEFHAKCRDALPRFRGIGLGVEGLQPRFEHRGVLGLTLEHVHARRFSAFSRAAPSPNGVRDAILFSKRFAKELNRGRTPETRPLRPLRSARAAAGRDRRARARHGRQSGVSRRA